MPNFHPKADHHGEGVKLVGNPADLINLMVTDATERDLVANCLNNEGPKHKQILSALLLLRLHKLVTVLEKTSGSAFELQEGYDLTKERDGIDITLPIAIPINLGSDIEKHQIAEAVSHAPDDESLAYAMCLQVIEWGIKAVAQK